MLLNIAFVLLAFAHASSLDFTVSTINSLAKSDPAKDCRAHISEVICLAENGANDGQEMGNMNRPCLPGSTSYTHFFEELYDAYPPSLQKMFCHLDRIFIEKRFFGTAYGGIIKNAQEQIVGAKIGVRESILSAGMRLSNWATWKEQLSFGGNPQNYDISEGLPHIETTALTTANDFLYFVIAHEFAHILDFTNVANKVEGPEDEGIPVPGSWGALAWETESRPLAGNDFLDRPFLCFYSCGENPLAFEKVPRVYDGLFHTNFISAYATTGPGDDFADTLAYYILDTQLKATYRIDTKQGAIYDVIEKLHSPIMQEKFTFLSNFLRRQDLRYPKGP